MLIERAKEQVINAYAPYSEFHVGAAVQLEMMKFLPEVTRKTRHIHRGFVPNGWPCFMQTRNIPACRLKLWLLRHLQKVRF